MDHQVQLWKGSWEMKLKWLKERIHVWGHQIRKEMFKWDQMTQQYISQTTVGQNTLGGRNTGMFLDDATFRQDTF